MAALFFMTLTVGEKRLSSTGLIKTGLLLGFGIALHNLPEYFAIGAGYFASQDLTFPWLPSASTISLKAWLWLHRCS